MSTTGSTQRTSRRRTGWAGLGFVVLLLLSAGMASVPGGDDSAREVRDFYTDATAVVVIAQLVGLVAAAVLAAFVSLLSGGEGRAPVRAVRRAGFAVVAAAVLVAVPVLALCAAAGRASDRWVHRLARLSDLTDVVLFVAIAVFAVSCALAATDSWLRVLGWGVAGLSVGRAVLLLAGSGVLGLAAPLAFIALVLAISVRCFARPEVPVVRAGVGAEGTG